MPGSFRSKMLFLASAAAIVGAAPCSAAGLGTALDPTGGGSFEITESEYHLPATVDPLVDATVTTELWAEVYRPVDSSGAAHPLLVLLHGNHATCGHYVAGTLGRVDDNSQYTTTGTCPTGYVVVPNHLGYSYLAERLASQGYMVVSINANRGINAAAGVPGDRGLNLRRGRLVLRHLMQLAQWNSSGGAPASLGFDLKGSIDFSHVGLFGHSRGGEGVLAAYTMYNDAGSAWPDEIGTAVHFDAMFELAPVDAQTSRTFVANNIPWTVLLPMCDGDVSDVEGVKVYDRTLSNLSETTPQKKSVYAVWGANHDFFNTQWQTSDSQGCTGAGNTPLFSTTGAFSNQQQVASIYAVMSLFRAHVGGDAQAAWGELLDPAFTLPAPLAAASTFERSFTDATELGPMLPVDDFTSGSSSAGIASTATNVTFAAEMVPNHDVTLSAGAVSWNTATQTTADIASYQINLAPTGSGYALSPYQTLEFRVALQCTTSPGSTYACASPNPLNGGVPTNFSIALVRADGTLTPSVALADYATVQGPVGGYGDNLHPVLQTVRIPLSAFGSTSALYRAARATFDRTPSGAIWLTDARLSQSNDADLAAGATSVMRLASAQVATASRPASAQLASVDTNAAKPASLAGGRLSAIRSAAATPSIAGTEGPATEAAGQVEVEVTSTAPIPVRDSLLTLEVDGQSFTTSRFADDGSTTKAIFTVSRSAFEALPDRAAVTLVDGAEHASFGTLDKSALR